MGRARVQRLAALAVVGVAVVAATAAPAGAEPPSVTAKRAEAQRVLNDIRSLDSQLAHAIEAYNAANTRLDRIHAAQRVNSRHLAIGKRNLEAAQRMLAERLRAIYVSDEDNSALAVILGSSSLGDVISRVETVSRVADQDRQVLREIRRFKRQVAENAAELRRANAIQSRLVEERASTKRQIESGLAERQRLLSSIQSEITRLQARERARQAQLRREAEARLRAQLAAAQVAPAETESIVGASAVTPEGETIAPPSRYGGVVGIAMQYLGVPYVWGGASPSGFDCSGFTMYVYAQVGVSLPHYAASQFGYGVAVSRDQLEPGDLVFFDGLGHMGMSIGGDQFIHAPHTGDVVKISSLNDPWYASTFIGARRL